MNIDKIDTNLAAEQVEEDGLVYRNALTAPFSVHGLMAPTEDAPFFHRIPRELAEQVNPGVAHLYRNSAGGRVRFRTDSSRIAVRVKVLEFSSNPKFSVLFTAGMDLYLDGQFKKILPPPVDLQDSYTAIVEFGQKQMHDVLIHFPAYGSVIDLEVGLDADARLEESTPYGITTPVVFYGSSITHGAAAGRPGNAYPSFISQKYNLDYVNLGFAGKALGETVMANYIASLDMCAFVCDFDHNANTVERLLTAHYRLYEIVRRSHPDIPYIIVTRPDYYPDEEKHSKLWAVIRDTYDRAIAAGDENVYFVDGRHLFDGEFYDSCTSDGIHPNDLGFYRMAEKIGPVVAKDLGIAEYR
jgi:hypothetical protein